VPDLLAHALLAYAAARVASLRWPWLSRPYVTAAMAGAFVPDVMKVRLLVRSWRVEALLGVPFDWAGLQTGGAAVLFVLVGAMIVAPRVRRRATLALGLGAATHLLADAMLWFPSGRGHPLLWPLSRWNPPTPGLWLSTQPYWTVLSAGLAVVAYWTWRRRGGTGAATRDWWG
jgi:hypothetical protein